MAEHPFWNAVPTVLWVVFLGAVIVAFRHELKGLLVALLGRLQQGASMKIGGVEVGAVVAIPSKLEKTEHSKTSRIDDGRRHQERDQYYAAARRVMLVHRLFPTTEAGQLYDILIYLVPAYRGTLSGVDRVEYFFGGYGWQNKVFVAADRSRWFPVLTAAYGPFLCTAEVFFTDGQSVILHRFVDFEMGNVVGPGK